MLTYFAFLAFQLITHSHFFKGKDEEDEDEEPLTTFPVAVITLLVSVGLIAICSEFLVHSLGTVSKNWGISETFIGMIIIPIVGNAAEHVVAVCKLQLTI